MKTCNKLHKLQWHLWQQQHWKQSCRHFSYLLIATPMWIMIAPYGKYSGTVTGGHRGGREVKWRHGAANCKWKPLRALNPSSWTKPCNFAGKKVSLTPRNKKGLGSVQARKIQALRNERRAVAVRTESRRCCSATVSLPALWSRPRAPQLSQNGIFLSSEHGKKCSIKKARALSTQMHTQARARACTALLTVTDVAPSYYAFINQKLVTGINLKRWRV